MAPGEVGIDLRIGEISIGGERTVRTFIFGGNMMSQGEGVVKNENTMGSSQQPTLAEIIIVIIATNIVDHEVPGGTGQNISKRERRDCVVCARQQGGLEARKGHCEDKLTSALTAC